MHKQPSRTTVPRRFQVAHICTLFFSFWNIHGVDNQGVIVRAVVMSWKVTSLILESRKVRLDGHQDDSEYRQILVYSESW